MWPLTEPLDPPLWGRYPSLCGYPDPIANNLAYKVFIIRMVMLFDFILECTPMILTMGVLTG